ncbi:MAG: alpha/beta hydrolase-fold protein [Vicinamibacterales bacterium]
MTCSRRSFLGLAALAAIGAGARVSAQALTPGQHPLGLDHERDGLLYLPARYQPDTPLPLLVLCHGAGGTSAAVAYAFDLAEKHGVIILAPDSRDQRTWDLVLGSYGPDADFLAQALGQTFRRCAVDRTRLAIGGHSDGASYALSFGIGTGDLFGHILAFSPGVMNPVDVKGQPRIFISHGTADNVMPIDDTSRRFVPRLRGLGYDVTYTEYDGRHAVPPAIVADGFDWLTAGWSGGVRR